MRNWHTLYKLLRSYMKFSKLDLLTLLISLFILNGCKNQDTIGLGVTSNNALTGSLIDTCTIVVNTIPEDTVVTSGLSRTPFGYFNDPVFGATEANIAMDLNLPGNSAYTLPTGTIALDSAILVLRYAQGFYGDSLSSRYKANVYQLNERVYSSNYYYNTKQWSYNSSILLGTKTFFPRPNDSIYVNAKVAKKPDSLLKVPPQLRIPIDPSFINTNLFLAGSQQLGSNLVFRNNVKGLYLTLDKTKSTGSGGLMMMALDSAANITVYYRTINGNTVDTTSLNMPSSIHAAQIKHTYSSTIQTELNNQTTGSRKAIYIQGAAGLRAKISFPYIKNLLKTLGTNIVINRAELVLTPTPGSTIPFAPIPQISMYKYDLAHTRTVVEDANTSDPRSQGYSVYGGYFSSTAQNYHFVITAYIQDLLLGATVDYGTFLGAVDYSTTLNYAATAQTANRTFAVGTDSSSPYRIKLNIIYTKLPK